MATAAAPGAVEFDEYGFVIGLQSEENDNRSHEYTCVLVRRAHPVAHRR